jgi:hypothetical protein
MRLVSAVIAGVSLILLVISLVNRISDIKHR